jgi:hypothetical protein
MGGGFSEDSRCARCEGPLTLACLIGTCLEHRRGGQSLDPVTGMPADQTLKVKFAHEVPVALFDFLASMTKEAIDAAPFLASMAEAVGASLERYGIEGSAYQSDVICVGPAWISLSKNSPPSGQPSANFRLWPREPEREGSLVGAPDPIFTIYGGPLSDGLWFVRRGNRYTSGVVVDYGYHSKIDLGTERGRHLIECASGILAIAVELSAGVERVTTWDLSTSEGS